VERPKRLKTVALETQPDRNRRLVHVFLGERHDPPHVRRSLGHALLRRERTDEGIRVVHVIISPLLPVTGLIPAAAATQVPSNSNAEYLALPGQNGTQIIADIVRSEDVLKESANRADLAANLLALRLRCGYPCQSRRIDRTRREMAAHLSYLLSGGTSKETKGNVP
jgi:hypothetical protein